VASAQKLAAYIKSMPADETPAQPTEQTLAVRKAVEDREGKTLRNVGMGAFKGVQDIGNTVINAGVGGAEMIRNAVTTPTLPELVTGQRAPSALKQWNEARKQSTDNLFQTESTPDTLAFKGGRLASNIAMTAPVGGALGQVATRAGLPVLGNALASGGFTTGAPVAANALGRAADIGVRVLGGGITGGASAGLVNPDDALMGAAIGGAAPVVVRGAAALGNLAAGTMRGLTEPFTESGRTAIAGRTLQRFGVDPADVQGLTNAPTITGARPGLAEQIARPEGAAGAARLEDAVRALDPQISASMAARDMQNNAARVDTLRNLAGQGGARDFAVANRAGTSGPMYQEAFQVDPGALNIPERELRSLMRTPAIRDAAAAARLNASNSGANVGASNASGSVEGLHQMKLALDDAITKASSKATPAGDNTVRGLRDAQRRLVDFIESISPEYANARGVHAQMSRPINQMDVAGEVLARGSSNVNDLSGYPRLMPNALMGAMGDEAQLIQRATGRNLGGSLNALMEPDQLNRLRGVANEVDRGAAVMRAGAGPGSPSAQRLASTNLLQQMGMSEGVTNNALMQTLMRPVQFGANIAEPRIQQRLLEILQNPAMAAEAMRLATPAERTQLQLLLSQATQAGARAAPVISAQR
jgi:hypothetical protein